MAKGGKKAPDKRKRCKVCGRTARKGKECCRRHAWLEVWGVRWFVRLREREPLLFKLIAWSAPISAGLVVAACFYWLSMSKDDVSTAMEETLRDNPEWFQKPLRDIIDEYGISAPQTGVLPRRGQEMSLEELKRLYPEIGTSVLRKADDAQAALSAQDYEKAERLYRSLVDMFPAVSGFHSDLVLSCVNESNDVSGF